ncbi:MAG: hypothetical protein O2912_06630, partial [Proteobacteria bacterium]|nr:hypothetical protein [Pseudomonadota bacterium]
MTINNETARQAFNGTGGVEYTFNAFTALKNADVKIIKTDENGIDTTLSENTDYTLTLDSGGGSFTTTVAVTEEETLTILRAAVEEQQSDFPRGGDLDTKEIEKALDLLTMLIQQHSVELGRAVHLSEADTSGGDMSLPALVANYLWAINSSADGIQLVDPASLATLAAFSTWKTDTFSGNASTVDFTLTGDPALKANTFVTIDGVVQHKATYSL